MYICIHTVHTHTPIQVCWHPTAEDTLAFGLEDGTVAVYDNIAQNYKTSSFEHKSGVKSVAWKLTPGTSDYTLWSCGGDGIVAENMHPLTKHAINVNDELQRVNKNPASVQV